MNSIYETQTTEYLEWLKQRLENEMISDVDRCKERVLAEINKILEDRILFDKLDLLWE